jgi:dihydrofolate reductase
MRKVVLYELMSLDGVADEPGEGQWFGDADHRLMENLADVIKTQDAVLLGRQTFDKWAPFWPTSTFQPFADFINNTPKFVFSSRSLDRTCSETTHVTEAPSAFVDILKRADGADIGIHGSLTLAQSLLRDHIVDEIRLVVAPSLAGEGRRLFDGSSGLQKFELVGSDRSAGCLLLHYRIRAKS